MSLIAVVFSWALLTPCRTCETVRSSGRLFNTNLKSYSIRVSQEEIVQWVGRTSNSASTLSNPKQLPIRGIINLALGNFFYTCLHVTSGEVSVQNVFITLFIAGTLKKSPLSPWLHQLVWWSNWEDGTWHCPSFLSVLCPCCCKGTTCEQPGPNSPVCKLCTT